MEERGLQSYLVIPGYAAHEVAGALVMDCFSESRSWPEALQERLAVPANLLFSAVLRYEDAAQIEELSGFERLITEIGATFATSGEEDIEPTIDQCLARLGTFLGVERAFVSRFMDNRARLVATNVWGREGISRESKIFELDLAEAAPFVADRLRLGQPFKLEPDTRPALAEGAVHLLELLDADGINSGVVVPIFAAGKPLGLLGVDSVERARTYSDELVERLRTLADLLGSTLARAEAEASLRASLAEVEQLRDQLTKENVYLRQEIRSRHPSHQIVGEDQAMLAVLDQARQVAPTESTVLIFGETGTGKELLAHFIHEASGRAKRPLIKVNCATLPASLVESELFGRERGAYTGAMTRQAGRFEVADGSTLLLDEIGELAPETQVKLLRVLQDGEFERLGSSKTIKTDVRVLAATNRDLVQDVANGRFREDLYYRLNVFPLTLPPLRERPNDIPLLTWHFVQRFADAMAKPIEAIERSTMSAFRSYPWPGNVRELQNVLERAMILCRGSVLEALLPAAAPSPRRDEELDGSLDGAQRRHILKIVERTGWRVRGEGGAAEILGMKPSTLENRMKKLGIERPH